MSARHLLSNPDLADYVIDHTDSPDPVAAALAAETAALGRVSGMQISHDQAVFLTMMTRLVGARRAVEVGTFTGYSSLAIARGLPEDGHLLCCDISEEWTTLARQAWVDAGVDDRIDLVLAPATETLGALPESATFDLGFIDADKEGYIAYHEAIVPRLRPGGVLLVDNVLWSGRVLDQDDADDSTEAIRAYNRHAQADDRLDNVILPIGDGVHFCRKR